MAEHVRQLEALCRELKAEVRFWWESCVERDAAFARGVEEGIERVRQWEESSMYEAVAQHAIDDACDQALASWRAECYNKAAALADDSGGKGTEQDR